MNFTTKESIMIRLIDVQTVAYVFKAVKGWVAAQAGCVPEIGWETINVDLLGVPTKEEVLPKAQEFAYELDLPLSWEDKYYRIGQQDGKLCMEEIDVTLRPDPHECYECKTEGKKKDCEFCFIDAHGLIEVELEEIDGERQYICPFCAQLQDDLTGWWCKHAKEIKRNDDGSEVMVFDTDGDPCSKCDPKNANYPDGVSDCDFCHYSGN